MRISQVQLPLFRNTTARVRSYERNLMGSSRAMAVTKEICDSHTQKDMGNDDQCGYRLHCFAHHARPSAQVEAQYSARHITRHACILKWQ
eukprot:1266309-Pleurochrysis_carterae.AAC.3